MLILSEAHCLVLKPNLRFKFLLQQHPTNIYQNLYYLLLLFGKLSPKFSSLKQTFIISYFLWAGNLKSSIAGCLAAIRGSARITVIWDFIDLEYLLSSSCTGCVGDFSSSPGEPPRRASNSMASSRVSDKRVRLKDRIGVGGGRWQQTLTFKSIQDRNHIFL